MAYGAALALGLAGAGRGSDMQQGRWFAMDTEFSALFQESGPASPDSALALLQSETARLERRFSNYLPGADLRRLRGRRGDTLRLDSETALLFAAAESLSETSQGRFDITLGPLKRAYGLGSGEKNRVPDSGEIARILAGNRAYQGRSSDFAPFHVLAGNRLVLLRDSLEFDLGALAKGYAVDRLSRLLDSLGYAAHLVQAGGDMRCSGTKAQGPWRIGIRHPRKPDSLCGVLRFDASTAVSTSGDYERFFLAGGIRYHHIFDPGTGAPAREFCSVTVLAQRSRDADGLSTALFVLGPEKGRGLLRRAGAEALWMRELPGGSLCAIASPGFRRHVASLSVPDCADHGIRR
jgi:thiamine biosynthesis lipoprotein